MIDAAGAYELTTSLRVEDGQPELLNEYIARLDAALAAELSKDVLVTAYFVGPGAEPLEIEVGLRFEGMKPALIEQAASHILDEAIRAASGGLVASPTPEREESTLVPA